MNNAKSEKIYWEISIPIFRNHIILKELGLALGIPFGLLVLFLLIVSGGDISPTGAAYPLISISILFLFAFLIIMLVYGGRYAAGYVIDENGILNYNQRKSARKNRIINNLAVMMGLATGRYSIAGAGMLAQTRQSVFVRWKCVTKVKVYPKSKAIVVKGGFAEKIALFCNDENYQIVKDAIMNKFEVNRGQKDD